VLGVAGVSHAQSLGVQPAGHGQVGGARPLPFDAGNLEHGGDVLQIGLAQQGAQRLGADGALPEVLMPVAARPERHLRVVEMDAAQTAETQHGGELVDERVGLGHGGELDAGGPQVLGIESDADARVATRGIDDRGQLGEAAADRPARASGVLEEHVADFAQLRGHEIEGVDDLDSHAPQSVVGADLSMAAGMQDEAPGAEQSGGAQVGR
jgi:hypothetical protein